MNELKKKNTKILTVGVLPLNTQWSRAFLFIQKTCFLQGGKKAQQLFSVVDDTNRKQKEKANNNSNFAPQ